MKLRWVAVFLVLLVLCLVPSDAAMAQLGSCAVQVGPDLPDLIVDQHFLRAQM